MIKINETKIGDILPEVQNFLNLDDSQIDSKVLEKFLNAISDGALIANNVLNKNTVTSRNKLLNKSGDDLKLETVRYFNRLVNPRVKEQLIAYSKGKPIIKNLNKPLEISSNNKYFNSLYHLANINPPGGRNTFGKGELLLVYLFNGSKVFDESEANNLNCYFSAGDIEFESIPMYSYNEFIDSHTLGVKSNNFRADSKAGPVTVDQLKNSIIEAFDDNISFNDMTSLNSLIDSLLVNADGKPLGRNSTFSNKLYNNIIKIFTSVLKEESVINRTLSKWYAKFQGMRGLSKQDIPKNCSKDFIIDFVLPEFIRGSRNINNENVQALVSIDTDSIKIIQMEQLYDSKFLTLDENGKKFIANNFSISGFDFGTDATSFGLTLKKRNTFEYVQLPEDLHLNESLESKNYLKAFYKQFKSEIGKDFPSEIKIIDPEDKHFSLGYIATYNGEYIKLEKLPKIVSYLLNMPEDKINHVIVYELTALYRNGSYSKMFSSENTHSFSHRNYGKRTEITGHLILDRCNEETEDTDDDFSILKDEDYETYAYTSPKELLKDGSQIKIYCNSFPSGKEWIDLDLYYPYIFLNDKIYHLDLNSFLIYCHSKLTPKEHERISNDKLRILLSKIKPCYIQGLSFIIKDTSDEHLNKLKVLSTKELVDILGKEDISYEY
ncbi:MAG: hypothetical protein HUJ68_07380 [Clostridia bacterium]|nr:hypothetical protein [Clostridia bacterium]